MTIARLAAGWPGVPRAPGCPFLVAGTGSCSSRCLRERVDALPGGGDRLGPWPGCLDFHAAPQAAAHEAGGGVQLIGRSVFSSARARSPSRASSLSQASRMQAIMAAVSRGVDLEVKGREMAQPGVLAGADRVLDPGLDAVGGVDVRVLAQPAFRARGPVRHPQAVPPPVLGLEQGELGAGMRPFPAGEMRIVAGQPVAGPRPGLRAAARSAR